jgi:hypothetical protein
MEGGRSRHPAGRPRLRDARAAGHPRGGARGRAAARLDERRRAENEACALLAYPPWLDDRALDAAFEQDRQDDLIRDRECQDALREAEKEASEGERRSRREALRVHCAPRAASTARRDLLLAKRQDFLRMCELRRANGLVPVAPVPPRPR